MARLSVSGASLAVLLCGCAHRVEPRAIPLPDAAEIGSYVAAHWAGEFDQVFSRFAGRPGQSSTFVSVQNARCFPNWGGAIAECSYDVTASFGADNDTRQLQSQFERTNAGALNETLVIWEVRKRRP